MNLLEIVLSLFVCGRSTPHLQGAIRDPQPARGRLKVAIGFINADANGDILGYPADGLKTGAEV